jgi:ribosomal protein S18 acetylase RimI-like enzyme
MDLEERRRLADANVLAAFRLAQERSANPKGGRAQFGAVHAVAVGVDVAFFNPVLALDRRARPGDVLAAIAWVDARGLPVSVQVREDGDPAIRVAVEALGLVAGPWTMPVMVLEPIGPPPQAPADVLIRTGGAELLDDWHAAIESSEVFRGLFGPTLVADPRVRLAVGYLAGEPVSAAAAVRSGRTLGVYAVATVERARRRGIGRAVTWAAIEAGANAWGSTIAVLQSSEMGVPVYRSMGFEEVARYVEFDRPKT